MIATKRRFLMAIRFPILKIEILKKYPSQCDLALELKISESLLSKIVRGRHEATPELRCAIAEKLGISEMELFS
jgi:transcriptional regulator with XRE-family HTH domain